jgi:RimJ/RimL family protein N-acetyltransferase
MSDESSASEGASPSDVRLETENLVLREIHATDVEAIHVYASDEEVVALLRWGPNSLEQTESWVASVIAERQQSPRTVHTFGICLRGEDRVVGAVRLQQPVASERVGRISFILSKDHWRRGLMAEAVREVVRFGLEDLGLNRISGTTPVENWGSGLVLEKAGFKKEALVDQHLQGKDDRWLDAKIYAVLKSSWPPKPEA